jgi:glycosidase
VPVSDAAPAPQAYDWRQRPIYMVMVDRFTNGDVTNDDLGAPDCFDADGIRAHHGGDLVGLESRADYLEQLGVGAVWITPLYEQVGCGYHGYWANYRDPDTRAMEPKFGSEPEFDALLDALHGRDIRLMLDMIVNHSGRGARIVEQRPDWFHSADGCAQLGPPEVTCPLSGLPDFAQEIDEVADYVTDISGAWLARFDIDGVRMDTAKHVAREYFIDHWFPRARSERPELFVVAEVFDASSAGVYEEYYDAGFDSVFHFAVRQGLIDVFANDASTNVLGDRVRDSIDSLGLERALRSTLFLDNHDVPRWSEEAGGSPDGKLRRYRLALSALFTLPGIPQLYYGDELGLTGFWPDNRRDMPAWAWTAGDRAGDHPESLPDAGGTYDHVRRLIAVRADNSALWRGRYAELWRQNGGDPVFVFFRADDDNRIIVVINNGDTSSEVRFRIATSSSLSDADRAAMPDGAQLDDLLGAGAPPTLVVEDGHGVVDMPGRSAGVYRVR